MTGPLLRLVRRLGRDTSGGSAAEFALVVPLLLLLIFGTMDGARLLWVANQADKATQAAVRMAVVTDFVPAELPDVEFTDPDNGGYVGGDPVPPSAVNGGDEIICDDSGCDAYGYDADAFDRIAGRAQQLLQTLQASQVRISYQHIGLGFAGDPTGADIAPRVSVWIEDFEFLPYTSMLWGGSTFTLSGFRSTMTMEDGSGFTSN